MIKTISFRSGLFVVFSVISSFPGLHSAGQTKPNSILYPVINDSSEYRSPTGVLTGGGIDNSGTIVIKGNLDNQSGSQSNLGTGTIEFSGISQQTMSGQNITGNLTLANSAGLVIGGNTEVNGQLTLTSGIVSLGSYNLLLGPSATIQGSPSAANMIVATGSGELRKSWSSTGSFLFPVGDNTGMAEFSPVTLNFNSGNFPSGNFIGVSLKNQPYNTTLYTGSYLNRYWTLTNASSNPVTSFSCDVSFRYVTADVTGTENQLFCTRVAPNPVITYDPANITTHTLTAPGLSSFGTYTATKGAITASFLAYIEGPFNSATNFMNTSLNASNKIPLSQPFNSSDVPLASVYRYNGTESVTSVPNPDIVDWVLVQLRQATAPNLANASTIFAQRACFLKKDGSIVDIDGVSNIAFLNLALAPGNNLYVIIRPRNHIAVMSSVSVTKNSSGLYTYNYSSGPAQIYGGSYACKQLQSSPAIWGLLAGDGNYDNNILPADFTLWAGQSGSLNGYFISDYNMDGNVLPADFTKWSANSGTLNQIP